MEQISYKVGELKDIIRESAQEFDAKLGANVQSDNKKNNEKSYKDAEKAAKDFDGGLKPAEKGKLPDKMDGNRTTLDYTPRTEVSKAQKDNFDAQAQGYTSKLEKDNGIAKAAEFDNDGKIKKNFEDAAKKINDTKEELAKSGIQGQNIKTEKKNTMYENTKPTAKRLIFKHTKFLNEAQMLSRVPEEYRVDGQKIYMEDAHDNKYVVECTKSEKSGLIEMNVTSHTNDRLMNEQVERINQLFNYESPKEFARSTNQERINESKSFKDIMDIARGLK